MQRQIASFSIPKFRRMPHVLLRITSDLVSLCRLCVRRRRQTIDFCRPSLKHSDADHFHRSTGSVALVGLDITNLIDDILAFDYVSEHWVLGFSSGEPVQVCIVNRIDEKLRSSRIFLSRVSHGKGVWLVTDLGSVFILNVPTGIPRIGLAVEAFEFGVRSWPTGSGVWRLRILTLWTSELEHEVFDDTVEMEAIVVLFLDQINDSSASVWHLVSEELYCESSHTGLKFCLWIFFGHV
mmetsp:Transcript_12544/g.14857  ORF Transcript_12544/g.14857 Transcript_12544/m.14857 type:complete len:238 (+) Transcript_12544:53-766(+)